jgi:hypothetical protein
LISHALFLLLEVARIMSSSLPEIRSPFSRAPSKVRISVEVSSDLADVDLIDHQFAVVASSIGHLFAEVIPGVYSVKVRFAGVVAERLILLNSDRNLDLSGELPLLTPAPLIGTSPTTPSDVAASVELMSHGPYFKAGSGAEIFLMVRSWDTSEQGLSSTEARRRLSLALRGVDGDLLVELPPVPGIRNYWAGEAEAWDNGVGRENFHALGCTVQVDPGNYIVQWLSHNSMPAEQTVVAVRGWQTSVFLLEETSHGDPKVRYHLSVLMSQDKFNAQSMVLRHVEEIRSVLAEERQVAGKRLHDWLSDESIDPMLGLLGANLLLLCRSSEHRPANGLDGGVESTAAEFDQGLFNQVVTKLACLLGTNHPDVIALSTRATDKDLAQLPPVTVPPMLWRSWILLIEASNKHPSLLPVGIWQRAAGLLPARPFLVWSPGSGQIGATAWEREIARVLAGSGSRRILGTLAGAAGGATAGAVGIAIEWPNAVGALGVGALAAADLLPIASAALAVLLSSRVLALAGSGTSSPFRVGMGAAAGAVLGVAVARSIDLYFVQNSSMITGAWLLPIFGAAFGTILASGVRAVIGAHSVRSAAGAIAGAALGVTANAVLVTGYVDFGALVKSVCAWLLPAAGGALGAIITSRAVVLAGSISSQTARVAAAAATGAAIGVASTAAFDIEILGTIAGWFRLIGVELFSLAGAFFAPVLGATIGATLANYFAAPSPSEEVKREISEKFLVPRAAVDALASDKHL